MSVRFKPTLLLDLPQEGARGRGRQHGAPQASAAAPPTPLPRLPANAPAAATGATTTTTTTTPRATARTAARAEDARRRRRRRRRRRHRHRRCFPGVASPLHGIIRIFPHAPIAGRPDAIPASNRPSRHHPRHQLQPGNSPPIFIIRQSKIPYRDTRARAIYGPPGARRGGMTPPRTAIRFD